MVADHFITKWIPAPEPVLPGVVPAIPMPTTWPPVAPYVGPTREQVQELIELLKAAKRIDEATGQPDCELDAKKQLLRQMAKHLGLDVEIP
jgi:hypothetical protein